MIVARTVGVEVAPTYSPTDTVRAVVVNSGARLAGTGSIASPQSVRFDGLTYTWWMSVPVLLTRVKSRGSASAAEVLKACGKVKAGATVSEKSAKYLPPIPNPGKILCIGLNYRKHAEETGNPIPEYPVVFCRFDNTLVGHNGKMPRPSHSA